MTIVKRTLCFLFYLFTLVVFSQEIPPIIVFTPQDYGAEDQNWSISQGEDETLYFANNKGLLQYNGARWNLYSLQNKTIARSVKAIENKIYTGCYMDFGYWVENDMGKLTYTSLVDAHNIEVFEDEQIWNIIDLENFVAFQSYNRIYLYNTFDDSIGIIESEDTITKIYKVESTIYFQKINNGIYKIENGKEQLVTNDDSIKDKVVTNIFVKDRNLLFQTKENGFLVFDDNVFSPWNIGLNKALSSNSIYSSLQLRNGDFLLGTVSNGIILLDGEGHIKLKINQNDGLSNNTILSVFEDKRGNIWLGMDNGINVININSPYRIFNDDSGVLGTVYTSTIYNKTLYIGTNQGLFYRPIDANDEFNFVSGTEGQVWCLEVINETLFCGHDRGTFVINGSTARLISEENGVWKILKVNNNPDLLLQGTYNGLHVLENIGQNFWRYRNKLEGFNISSRYFEFLNDNTLFVNHEYKGIYKLSIDPDFTKITASSKLNISKGVLSSLIRYENDLLYAYEKGIFKYSTVQNKFVLDSTLSQLYDKEKYVSGNLLNNPGKKKLWLFSENGINYAEPGKLTSELQMLSIPLRYQIRNTKAGYENILKLTENKYLIGSTDGYIIADIDAISPSINNISLDRVSHYALNEPATDVSVVSESNFENKSNNIILSYSVANYYKFLPTEYSHRLLGFNDNWSQWSYDSTTLYENLPYGEYTFEAKARVGQSLTANTITYIFTIEKPWYLKPLAIAVYVLGLLVLFFMTHTLYKNYYKNQRQKLLKKKERELEIEQLESQRQIMAFKNKNLQLDIDNKNRELGTATMNLVKRNELLNDIKEKLSKSKSQDDVKDVIKIINSSLNNTNDWKLFEEAFNNVDKDFMKKVKSTHPSVTTNDLRLCAYLRLNLSSKEIAPLLNISHKSVEVKRYRLRKKMGLDHEKSLTNYILEL